MSFVRTPPGADPIVVRAKFPVPPARVFAAWTDPEIVVQWFGVQPGTLVDAVIDLRPGGRWRFIETRTGRGWTGFEGEYLQIVADELLTFTWAKITTTAAGESNATPKSRVEIRITAAGDGTEMTINHTGLDDESRIGFRFGWEAGTSNLVQLLR